MIHQVSDQISVLMPRGNEAVRWVEGEANQRHNVRVHKTHPHHDLPLDSLCHKEEMSLEEDIDRKVRHTPLASS